MFFSFLITLNIKQPENNKLISFIETHNQFAAQVMKSPALHLLVLYAACRAVCWLRFPLSTLSHHQCFNLGCSPQQAQCCNTNMAAVLGAVSESLHSSPVQPSSTVCARAPAPVRQPPTRQGLAVPLQHRLCQDDCIRPVRRFPVNDLPWKVD